jgi:hypothetical protein
VQSSVSQQITSSGFSAFRYIFYGLAGFILNQNYLPKISTSIDANLSLTINAYTGLYSYINLQYVVFAWSPCSNCAGYPFVYNGQCYPSCPTGTLVVGNNCVQCPTNSYASNGVCVCSQGYYNISGVCCTCPTGSYFNGVICVNCGANAVLIGGSCQCQQGYYNISGVCSTCPQGQQWNGVTCVSLCGSQPGTTWNGQSCVCSQPGTVWNGQNCSTPIPQCCQNSYWNGQICVCTQPGAIWNGQSCQPPPQPQCGANAYYNGQ